MRVVVWNCRQALARKMAVLDQLDSDIAVIPECSPSALPDGRSVWVGENPVKGLGVISRSDEPSCVELSYDDGLRWFLPVEFKDSPIKLLAVWAFNHRDCLKGHSTLNETVKRYHGFLEGCDTIIAGDMKQQRHLGKTWQSGLQRCCRAAQ